MPLSSSSAAGHSPSLPTDHGGVVLLEEDEVELLGDDGVGKRKREEGSPLPEEIEVLEESSSVRKRGRRA